MAKRPPQRKNADIDIFDDVDLDVAQSMLPDATGEVAKEPDGRGERPVPKLSDRAGQRLPSVDGQTADLLLEDDEQLVEDAISVPVVVEPTNVLSKFSVRQATRARFDSFKAELRAKLGGTRLSDANIGRALLGWILFEVDDEILNVERVQSVLRRPPPDDAAAMAEFDDALRVIFEEGVQRCTARHN